VRRPSAAKSASQENLHDRILNGDPDALVASALALLDND